MGLGPASFSGWMGFLPDNRWTHDGSWDRKLMDLGQFEDNFGVIVITSRDEVEMSNDNCTFLVYAASIINVNVSVPSIRFNSEKGISEGIILDTHTPCDTYNFPPFLLLNRSSPSTKIHS